MTKIILASFGGHSRENASKRSFLLKVGFFDNLRFLSSFENEEDPETIAECFKRSNKLKSYYLTTSTALIPSSITKETANRKIETQKSFYSTARKRLRAKPLSKKKKTKKNKPFVYRKKTLFNFLTPWTVIHILYIQYPIARKLASSFWYHLH